MTKRMKMMKTIKKHNNFLNLISSFEMRIRKSIKLIQIIAILNQVSAISWSISYFFFFFFSSPVDNATAGCLLTFPSGIENKIAGLSELL